MASIKKINALYDEENEIVLWAARVTTTGIDWFKFTKEKLDSWGLQYHKLTIVKPYYDIWIDDKCINVKDFEK